MLAATRTKGIKSWGVSKHDRHQNTANCAVNWRRPDPEGITCYCIIPGQPGILHFEDLGDN